MELLSFFFFRWVPHSLLEDSLELSTRLLGRAKLAVLFVPRFLGCRHMYLEALGIPWGFEHRYVSTKYAIGTLEQAL
jgi:hypothetical protein